MENNTEKAESESLESCAFGDPLGLEKSTVRRDLAALTDDLSLDSSTHIGLLTTICDFSSWESDALFWPPWAPTLTRAHTLKNKSFFFLKERNYSLWSSISYKLDIISTCFLLIVEKIGKQKMFWTELPY